MSSNISNVRLSYVYLIRHIPSGKFYAGSRTSKKCHPSDFWVSYHTSSKIVKQIISEEGKDSFEILEIIPRPNGDALDYEVALLKSVDAAKSGMWLNKSNGQGKFINIGHCDKTKAKISASNKGKAKSLIHRINLSISHKNPSDAIRANISASHKGKTHSIQTKLKLSKIQLGCVFTDKHKANISAARIDSILNSNTKAKISATLKGRTQPKALCPHCGKIAGQSSITRFHGDKCKSITL